MVQVVAAHGHPRAGSCLTALVGKSRKA